MKKLFFYLALPLISCGQDVTDVAARIIEARTPIAIVATVTATSGDGTVCRIVKIAGQKINARLFCTSRDGRSITGSAPLTSTSDATQVNVFGAGDVLCLIAVNPTANAAPMGSLGSVPANGLAWSCTTNTSAGQQTPPVNGSVAWP